MPCAVAVNDRWRMCPIFKTVGFKHITPVICPFEYSFENWSHFVDFEHYYGISTLSGNGCTRFGISETKGSKYYEQLLFVQRPAVWPRDLIEITKENIIFKATIEKNLTTVSLKQRGQKILNKHHFSYRQTGAKQYMPSFIKGDIMNVV